MKCGFLFNTLRFYMKRIVAIHKWLVLLFGRDGLMLFAACANTAVSLEVRYVIGKAFKLLIRAIAYNKNIVLRFSRLFIRACMYFDYDCFYPDKSLELFSSGS